MQLIEEVNYPTKTKKLLQIEYKFDKKSLELGDFFYFYSSLVQALSKIENIKLSSFSITNENKISGDGNIYFRLYEILEGKAWDKFEEFISNPENLVSSFCVEGTLDDETFIIAIVPMFNQSLVFTFVNDPIEIKKISDLLNTVEQDLYKTLGDKNGKVN